MSAEDKTATQELNDYLRAKAKFEREYASRSDVSLEDLYSAGLRGYPCRCDDKTCKGWQMITLESAEIQVHLGHLTAEDVALTMVPELTTD